MAVTELICDCPRCGTKKITFSVIADNLIKIYNTLPEEYELIAVCRKCNSTTIFIASPANYEIAALLQHKSPTKQENIINRFMKIHHHVTFKDMINEQMPEHLPEDINNIYLEGSICTAIECYNAAGAMFRLCLDLVTKQKLPKTGDGVSSRVKNYLHDRLVWLFANNILPSGLQELSLCIKEDGNDGVHDGSLTKAEAEDLKDFTNHLLEEVYSRPAKIQLAKDRKNERRSN